MEGREGREERANEDANFHHRLLRDRDHALDHLSQGRIQDFVKGRSTVRSGRPRAKPEPCYRGVQGGRKILNI